MFSQTTQMQLAYQHTDVDYDENSLNTGLYDYRYQVITATLTKQLSERNQVFITGGYSEYHVEETDFDSETRNLQVGLTTNFTESIRGTLQAGQRRTESFYKSGALICSTTISVGNSIICTAQIVVPQDIRTESRDSVFSGSLESKSESSDWNLVFSRSLQPSSTGGQVEQDMFGFQFNKRLTSRLRTNIRGSAHEVRTFEGNFSNNDRKYYELGPGIFWQWTRDWAVGANYRYVHVKREFENEAAESNSVNLLLSYRPLKMAISR
jgi:lipopolysaccharide assembly outer membrane protein LptD (OstA)